MIALVGLLTVSVYYLAPQVAAYCQRSENQDYYQSFHEVTAVSAEDFRQEYRSSF